ncbi:hypothetical protein F5Y04DRAFT_279044 [Hypomontagnella monticulosa]|nr:hypothetical protein F5Y04DRAFT_279044 [Hypomontagnella monticulosa]
MDVDSEDRGPGFQAFIIVMTILTVLAITLRFWSRSLGVRRDHNRTIPSRYWWDDWAALAAVPFILGDCGLLFGMVHYGLGRHVWTVPPDELAVLLKLTWANYLLYDFALFCTKTSALLFFSRVFPKTVAGTWFNIALYVVHGINVCWLLGIIFGTVFMCDPVYKNWDVMAPGTCGPTSALWIGSAVPSVCIDLIILLLPMPQIWRLSMSGVRKVGISIVFLLGYCVIVVSLGRLITLFLNSDGLNRDISYESIPICFWVTCEAPITLLSICLPAMLPLGRHVSKNYLSSLASSVQSLLGTRKSNDDSFADGRDNTTATEGSRFLRTRKSKRSIQTATAEKASVHSANSARGALPGQEQWPPAMPASEKPIFK